MADRDARCWNCPYRLEPPPPTPAILILTGGLSGSISTECFLEFPVPGWDAETGASGVGFFTSVTTVSVTINVTFATWQLCSHCVLIPNLSKRSCGITLHSVFPPTPPDPGSCVSLSRHLPSIVYPRCPPSCTTEPHLGQGI